MERLPGSTYQAGQVEREQLGAGAPILADAHEAAQGGLVVDVDEEAGQGMLVSPSESFSPPG
jgi:hypothetical protein